MRVSSFKPQYRQAPLRSGTPPPPSYEPLSPILRPVKPPTANPAGGKDKTTKDSNSRRGGAPQQARVHNQVAFPPLQLDSPTVAYEAPLHSAPLPRTRPQYSPALGSPIDALANAAVSSLQASPAHFDPPRRPSYTPISPATAVAYLPSSERAPAHAYQNGTSYAHDERPAKRARSEFLPSPQYGQQHSRPATSHMSGWSYNVEQMVDNGVRMYHGYGAPIQHPEESQSKRLSDAQLLLEFHQAASVAHTAKPQEPSSKKWSISHAHASHPLPTRTMDTSDPPFGFPYLDSNRAQHTYPPAKHVNAQVSRPGAGPSVDQSPVDLALQTHTPPEDIPGSTAPLPGGEVDVPEKKARKHQGWPKGKPRGPRASSMTSKKKKSIPKSKGAPPNAPSTAADQLHSPQSLPADGKEAVQRRDGAGASSTELQAQRARITHLRRHSHSNTFAPELVPTCSSVAASRAQSVPLDTSMTITQNTDESGQVNEILEISAAQTTICRGCHSSDSLKQIGDGEQWISCDGCKGWFHFACAGFTSEREVREIDKFYCDACRPSFGDTTKVRKSGRAHTAVDYAGLNEGILKTSDDNPEHHYIQAFKNGDLGFTPETFARLPPECVTADFIEKMNGFREPIVVPACSNPRPEYPCMDLHSPKGARWSSGEESYGYEMAPDDGQDRIDMVIPKGLTVRRVSELYGPMERVPVIDVKAQEGEDKRWTMAKWADYYEQEGEKPVRNVISLEVSRSRLGKLIRRPKAVRDMDLQDSVWPEEDSANAPPVQFYCLMSVADCYTDFHIDFGGSSVYYHIIQGRKTFFFIPPTKQNLKKYEDWCLSPRQSHEFLGHQVKECYRVDLYAGDTMLIPSGWIHAVWTPEDSLVIGGNYLTRIHYGMQIKVVEVEKNTKVAPKFRYPFFQKIMWLVTLRYLEEDPLPLSVEEVLLAGGQFQRTIPIYCEPDKFGHNSHMGPENYNRRYYSKAELEGLPDLAQYIWRTVLISLGRIEGITQQTRNAVTRSIPKGHGEPLVLARRFATWIAWKRGNESIPQWAHRDASLPDATDSKGEKKLSAAQLKKLERETWRVALHAANDRHPHRTRGSEPLPATDGEIQLQTSPVLSMTGFLRPSREHVTTPKTSQLGPKRIACDACRKRRIRCKHKDDLVETPRSAASSTNGFVNGSGSPSTSSLAVLAKRRESDADPTLLSSIASDVQAMMNGGPTSTELNAEALAHKSGRMKACPECRKSKRRCIHDENGNVDPVKAAETPVPRGSISKKRRTSGEDEDGEALNKKMKKESFAGLIDGEASHWNRYPVQRPAATSDPSDTIAVSLYEDAIEQSPLNEMDPVERQLFDDAGETIRVATPSREIQTETVLSSIENRQDVAVEDMVDGPPIDPQLLEQKSPAQDTPPRVPPRTPNGVVPHASSPPSASMESASPAHSRNDVVTTNISTHRPRSLRVTTTPRKTSRTPRPPNTATHTPKSISGGKGRRDSKGSIKVEPRSENKPRSMSSVDKFEEDDASLALAMKLQMEEHGLRRRS